MGRKKVEIKKILNNKIRNVTFGKRRRGLFKKAAELALLCDAKINIILSDQLGNYTEFISSNQKSKSSIKMGLHSLFTIEHYPKFQNPLLTDQQEVKETIKAEGNQQGGKEMISNYYTNSGNIYFDQTQHLENMRVPYYNYPHYQMLYPQYM